MFKKTILTAAILLSISANAFASSDVLYCDTDDDNDYSGNICTVACDPLTGEIISFSGTLYDGEVYAYAPNTEKIIPLKVTTTDFTDIPEYEGMFAAEMSARKIMVGNGDGTFAPNRVLTRAEAAAVFSRLFSVEPKDGVTYFEDTPTDSWFTPYVNALCERGVFKKDRLFNPNNAVTREQFISMMCRMLSDMGYIKNEGAFDFEHYTDSDLVSDYAKESYAAMKANGYMLIEDYEDSEDTGEEFIEYYCFAPQNGLTRDECATYMYYIIRDFFANNAPAILRSDAPNVDIPRLDGSTSTYAITQNIYDVYYKNAHNLETMPKAHSKTSNSYKNLIDGKADVIFVPDPSEEITKYADEKNVKLKFIPIANEALVFFVGKDNKVNNITTEQIQKIYTENDIKNWKELGGDDVALAAYCRNNDSGSHAQMEKFILGGKSISDEISKERTSYIMASILTDVESYDATHTDSKAIGYSLYYYYQTVPQVLGDVDLKLLSIDGIAPSDESIGSGKYPYTTNYYAVIRDEPNPKTEEFVKLMQGDFGKDIISCAGLGVINDK